MDSNLFAIIGIAVVILLLILPLISWGPCPRCPDCGSRKVGVQKTPTGMRTTDSGAGGDRVDIHLCKCNTMLNIVATIARRPGQQLRRIPLRGTAVYYP